MALAAVPCGRSTFEFSVPDENFLGSIVPNDLPEVEDEQTAVKRALARPIGSPRLRERVYPGQKIVIVATDNSRYASEQVVIPAILEELDEAHIRPADITIVVATGTHDPNGPDECISMFGREVVERVRIENHTAFDDASLAAVGVTRSQGIPVAVNKTVAEADVRISTGVIEPHLLAGYSGGVKSIAVGVAGARTIQATHNVGMFEHPKTRLGVIEDNIFRQFLEEAAQFVGLDFIVNVVLSSQKKILGVFAGDSIQAHQTGVRFARKVYEVPITQEADIVIAAPGYPKDKNLYQATRAFNTCLFGPRPVLRKGGVAILPMACPDGLADVEGKSYLDFLKRHQTPEHAYRHIRSEGFQVGEQKAYFLSRALSWADVMAVGCQIPRQTLQDLFIIPHDNIGTALEAAFAKLGRDAKVWVLPHAVITVPVLARGR